MSSITRIPIEGCPGLFLRETATGQVYEGRIKHRGASLRRTLKARTLQQAKRELAAWRVDLGRDVPEAQPRQSGTSFADAYALYVERLQAEGRSANTIYNAAQRYAHLESLHRRNLASISRDEVVTITRRLLSTHKPSSVRSVATLGNTVYGEAMERGLTTHNPFSRLRLPEAAKGPKRNLSPSDVHALIDGATDLMRPFVATVAFTGARISEALGLKWSDIDLDAGIIDISGQLQRGERTGTKTDAGVRGIGIPEQLVTLLKAHRRRQVERGVAATEDSFVFASATGTPMDRRRGHRVVQAAARKAKLTGSDENLRVHDLRSAFALNSLRDGMTLPELQKALGHTKPDQSLEYAALVGRSTVIRSSAYDRDEAGEVVELRKAV